MSSNMYGGWKVNPTEIRRQKSIEEQYRETEEWKNKNAFRIYLTIIAILLLWVLG